MLFYQKNQHIKLKKNKNYNMMKHMSAKYMTPMEASIVEMETEREAEERPKHKDNIDQSRNKCKSS